MSQKILVLGFVFGLLLGCSDGSSTNNDNGEEVGCNQLAPGTWVVSAVACGGSFVSFPYSAFRFESNGKVTRVFGGPDCQSSYTSNVTHTVPNMTLVGEQTYSCSQSGASVPSCSGTDTSCNSAQSAENITNSYSICVLRNFADIRLSRTVAVEDIANQVTLCASAGQIEELVLIPEPKGIAFLSISDGAVYDFGAVTVGSPATKIFTITNTGDTEATAVAASGIATPFLFVGGAFPGVGGTCGTTLAAYSSCAVEVEFNPTAAGTFEDTLIIAYHDGRKISSTMRALTGSATAPAAAVLTLSGADPIDFGSVTAGLVSAPLVITVTNAGNLAASAMAEVTLAAPFQYTGGVYPGASGTCVASLAASSSCSLEIEFAPAIVGPASGSITMSYNNGSGVQSVSRQITGLGI